MVGSFDTIAELYGTEFADKPHRKPADRELFNRLAEAVPVGRLVLEVGAGPGQVSAYLASKGVPVIVLAHPPICSFTSAFAVSRLALTTPAVN